MRDRGVGLGTEERREGVESKLCSNIVRSAPSGSLRTLLCTPAGGCAKSSVCACVSLKVSPDAMGWCERHPG
jgi:hypothetical protein